MFAIEDIIDLAIQIEEKETLDHLDAIIEEENSHIRLLQESLDSGIVETGERTPQ